MNLVLGFQEESTKPAFAMLILLTTNCVICPSSVLETEAGAQSEGFPLFANLTQQDLTARCDTV